MIIYISAMIYLLLQADILNLKSSFSGPGSSVASFIYVSQWFMEHIFMLYFIFKTEE